MAFMTSFDKTRLYYRLSRRGSKALVFIHGWPHNHSVWNREAAYFQNKNYSTLTMDLRGHGKSGMPPSLSSYKMDNFAKDLYTLIQKNRLIKPVLVGHSFGGMIILKFMEMYPKTADAIVLIDSTYHNPLKNIGFLRQSRLSPLTIHLLKFILKHEHIQKKHFEQVDFSKLKNHSDLYCWLKGAKETPVPVVAACLMEMLRFNAYRSLGKIRVPALIIEGQKDDKIPAEVARKMHRAIKRSRLTIIRDAAHDTNLSRPNSINKAIHDFLKNNKITP